jgi:hypothetical protein
MLGCPEVVGDPDLRKLLWMHQFQGGFESALAELQLAYSRGPNAGGPALGALQSAVSRTFTDMNTAFLDMPGWEFQRDMGRMVGTFLTRFDAIFTLIQNCSWNGTTPTTTSLWRAKKSGRGQNCPA